MDTVKDTPCDNEDWILLDDDSIRLLLQHACNYVGCHEIRHKIKKSFQFDDVLEAPLRGNYADT
jgi:hypothetical protein